MAEGPRKTSALPTAALLALALLAGCAEGPQPAPQTACDPLADGGCPPAERCVVVAEGALCRPPTSSALGQPCTAGSCAPGEACTAVEGLLACRPLCDIDGDRRACPDDGICGYRLAGVGLGVCPTACAVGDDCGSGATCGISAVSPTPICVAAGPAAEGESCDGARCGPGLACLSAGEPPARCIRLCAPDGPPCPRGACVGRVVGVDGVGYCTDDS